MLKILFRVVLLLALPLTCGAVEARADTDNNADQQKRLEFSCIPERCPLCGSAKVAPILYGLPNFNEELERALDEGKIALGGCEITGDDPSWKCLNCGAVFYDQNNTSHRAPDAPPPTRTISPSAS